MKKNNYIISQLLVGIFTYILFRLFFINEDKSWYFLAFYFGLLSFGFGFIGKKQIMKIFDNFNKIKNFFLKFLYLLILQPIKILIVFIFVYLVTVELFSILNTSTIISLSILLGISWLIICFVYVPFVQTIFLLLLKKI